MSSPSFLSNSENPGTIMTSHVLTLMNYDMWSKSMMNALRAKNKEGFVNGVLREPVSSGPEAGFWKVCNFMMIQWILNTVDKSIESSISYGESVTTKVVWDGLREYFCVRNGSKVHELKREDRDNSTKRLKCCRLFYEAHGDVDELSNCTRIPCCNYGAVADYARNNDEENLHQFLLDLDDSIFDTIYSQILSMKPLPTQSKAYSLITPKESHRIVIRDQDERIEGAKAFAVQTAR